MFTTLISIADAATLLDTPSVRFVDCRFELADPSAGRAAFEVAHVPGAVYADLDRDLAAPAGECGRHPLPDRGALTRRFGDWGITNDTQVVAYDAHGGMVAARLWWLSRWLGHAAVAVLDGGLGAWETAGLPLTSEVSTPPHADFQAREPLTRTTDADTILRDQKESRAHPVLIDARAHERFSGAVEPIDFKAGHIPGAVCMPFADNLRDDGTFHDAARLRQNFGAIAPDERPVVCYCGSGVSAAHNVLALVIAGYPEPLLYPGSWSEWIRDDSRPTAP